MNRAEHNKKFKRIKNALKKDGYYTGSDNQVRWLTKVVEDYMTNEEFADMSDEEILRFADTHLNYK